MTRAQFLTLAGSANERSYNPSRRDDEQALQQMVVDYNAGLNPRACGPAGWSGVLANHARRFCERACEEFGTTISEFEFDTATCSITACECEGIDAPKPGDGPVDFSAFPFGNVLDGDHWDEDDHNAGWI